MTATNVELAIALPLGVVANQLMRVESDLRFLSAKTSGGDEGHDSAGMTAQVAARLEQISATLENILVLLGGIERDLQPKSSSASKRRRDDRDD